MLACPHDRLCLIFQWVLSFALNWREQFYWQTQTQKTLLNNRGPMKDYDALYIFSSQMSFNTKDATILGKNIITLWRADFLDFIITLSFSILMNSLERNPKKEHKSKSRSFNYKYLSGIVIIARWLTGTQPTSQSEANILVTWSLSTNQRPVYHK